LWLEICRERVSMPPLRPSTDTIRSPSCSTLAAGWPFSIAPTSFVGCAGPVITKIAQKITNAISTFMSGPAAITTMRFHTAWR
jgi:hypothetical protein